MSDSGKCMSDGCLCCYDAYDCNCTNCVCCYVGAGDCLCLRHSCCFAIGAKPRLCGISCDDSKGEICKIGCCFCDYALIFPTSLCAFASQMWCCYSVGSFPCSNEYVDKAVCAYCFIQCCPTCGCCIAPPDCPALNKLMGDDPSSPPPPPQAQTMDHAPTQSTTETVNPDGSRVITTTITNPDGSKTVTESVIQPHPIATAPPSFSATEAKAY